LVIFNVDIGHLFLYFSNDLSGKVDRKGGVAVWRRQRSGSVLCKRGDLSRSWRRTTVVRWIYRLGCLFRTSNLGRDHPLRRVIVVTGW